MWTVNLGLAALVVLGNIAVEACSDDELSLGGRCYKLFSNQPVTLDEALLGCYSINSQIGYVGSMAALNNLGLAAVALGIASNPDGPGVWLPFERQEVAPPSLSNYLDIRSDPVTYIYKYVYQSTPTDKRVSSSTSLDPALWRPADPVTGELAQPGDKTDARDERCAALKNVGSQNIGADSYSCTAGPDGAYMKHYALCHQGD